jgi:hypothetical protein
MDRRSARAGGTKSASRVALAIALLVACGVLFGGVAAAASAAVGFTVLPTLPGPLGIGQANAPGSLEIENASSGLEDAPEVRLGTITLVPSCDTGAISSGDCPAAAADPGVLELSSSGNRRGRHLETVAKKDPEGRYVLTLRTGGLSLKVHHLVALVRADERQDPDAARRRRALPASSTTTVHRLSHAGDET